MQTKEQWKRNWKVIAATTAVSALGLGGAAIADSRDSSAAPAPISLSDRANIKAVTNRNLPLVGSTGADLSADLDSPFADFSQQTGDSPDADSPASPSTFDSPDSPASLDSPDVTPAAQADSPASVDSPADDSPASVDSPADDSPASVDSPASASADS
jgi:hypothetical protein